MNGFDEENNQINPELEEDIENQEFVPVEQVVEQPELSDMDVARQDRDRLQQYGNLVNAFQTMIQGMTGAKSTKAGDTLIKQGEQRVEDVKADRLMKVKEEMQKMQKEKHDAFMQKFPEDLKLAKAQAEAAGIKIKNDTLLRETDEKKYPGLKVARFSVQQLYDKNRREAGLEPEDLDLENTSLAQLAPIQDFLEKGGTSLEERRVAVRERMADSVEGREGRLTKKQAFKIAQKAQDDARTALKDLRATDTFKSAEKTLVEIPTLNNLLEDAYNVGGQSLSMLGPKVARSIAGEVGVLTDQDVTRYVKNPELVGGMLDTLAKVKDGKISEGSYENLKRLLEIAETEAKSKMSVALDREAELFSRREGISKEDAMFLLDKNFKKPQKEDEVSLGESVIMEAPNGQRRKVKKENVQKYLDKGAKIVE